MEYRQKGRNRGPFYAIPRALEIIFRILRIIELLSAEREDHRWSAITRSVLWPAHVDPQQNHHQSHIGLWHQCRNGAKKLSIP